MFGDDVYFHLDGYARKLFGYGVCTVLKTFMRKMQPHTVTVFWFENETGSVVTINGECYENMVHETFWHLCELFGVPLVIIIDCKRNA